MSFFIHKQSKLTAAKLVSAIKASKKVPRDYQVAFSAKGVEIAVSSKISLPLPKGVKSGGVAVAKWFEMVCFASEKSTQKFPYNDWQITTGAIVGEKRFLAGATSAGIGERISIAADLPPGQLVLLRPPQATQPTPTSPPKAPSPKRVTFPGNKMPVTTKSPQVIPKSLGPTTALVSSTFAATDALGMCIPNHKWPGISGAAIGHRGTGGLLIVANRVDLASFKNPRDATSNAALVALHFGSTLIHEMIHAGRYASGEKQWVGHPSAIFGPFL